MAGGGEQGTEAGGGGRGWHRDQSCMEKRYEIIQENSIRGSYLHPGLCPHPRVSVPELSHDFWVSGVALVGGGVGLCPRLC